MSVFGAEPFLHLENMFCIFLDVESLQSAPNQYQTSFWV
jgi:hypothetical protein